MVGPDMCLHRSGVRFRGKRSCNIQHFNVRKKMGLKWKKAQKLPYLCLAMVRWHKPSCTTPQVEVDDVAKAPHCTSCNSSPNLEELAAAVAGFSPLPPIPPDEPLDNLNLFWPPTVNYTYPATPQSSNNDPTEGNSPSPLKARSEPIDPSTLLVYGRALKPDEFRLLRLPFADPADPVHITLEICHDDDHPNYETCSYAWGGEAGDSTLCKPVFVGEYWDILFQTQNCWDMLKCLRPKMRTLQRVLWVDAICINQRDPYGEREEQVEKMFQLYRMADRVVVFLGKDMFGDLGEGEGSKARTYPKKREVSEMAMVNRGDGGQISLPDLLRRDYFKRLWVVQELLIAQRVDIRVGNTEYWINSTTVEKRTFFGHGNWGTMPAPWFQYAARGGSIGDSQQDSSSRLLNMMIVTDNCLSADPRDKVFGVLALAQAGANNEHLIRPDYSLSLRHIMIGAFAHCLIVDDDTHLLWAASGIRGWSDYPSWAPAWNASKTFKMNLMVTAKAELTADSACWRWQSGGSFNLEDWALCDFAHLLGSHTPNTQSAVSQGESIETSVRQKRLSSQRGFLRCSPLNRRPIYFRITPSGRDRRDPERVTPRTRITAVSGITGGLSVQLMHLCQLNAQPLAIDHLESTVLYSVAGSLFFISETEGLEDLVDPENDHLFVLQRGKKPLMFFILRAADYDLWQFKVVAPCYQVFIKSPHLKSTRRKASVSLSQFERPLSQVIEECVEPDWESMDKLSPSWWKLRYVFILLPHDGAMHANPEYLLGITAIMNVSPHAWTGSDDDLLKSYVKAMKRIHGSRSVSIYESNGVQIVEVWPRWLSRSYEGKIDEWNSGGDWYLFNRASRPVLNQEDFLWREVSHREARNFILRSSARRFGSPLLPNSGSGPFALRAPKDRLLKVLRDGVREVDVLGGRLNGKDGSCWKAWKAGPPTGDAPESMKLGPVNAKDLTWPHLGFSGWGRGKVGDGGLVFDGMTYQVEII
ncbi:heterokaryon incompatibility protein-domain-containing protein [Apiosordaria backusii]|uniref:Heterokaryon incompatibility protein-domain-containing protein n=1 Tax=Apiosordaria backusii TaxID=314023 RepID=A0AA40ASN2_9PEZI|nr:heterokaryon incompatibility protein-domain-containing protein [Apiosordaria backusii]